MQNGFIDHFGRPRVYRELQKAGVDESFLERTGHLPSSECRLAAFKILGAEIQADPHASRTDSTAQAKVDPTAEAQFQKSQSLWNEYSSIEGGLNRATFYHKHEAAMKISPAIQSRLVAAKNAPSTPTPDVSKLTGLEKAIAAHRAENQQKQQTKNPRAL